MANTAVITGSFHYNEESKVDEFYEFFSDHTIEIFVFGDAEEKVKKYCSEYNINVSFLGDGLLNSQIGIFKHLITRGSDFDVYFVYGSPQIYGIAATLVSKITNVPIITRFNGYKNPDSMFKYLFTRSAESFLLTVSDASIFLADQHRDDIFQQLPISDRESSRIIPPGTQYWYEHAALEETKQIRQEHNLATNDYLVGSVIKPRRIKRIDRAIDIVSIAEDIIGEDIYYMIVGPKSQEKYISEIKSYIQKKGMEDNIIWADEKPSKELPPYYTAFDATVMTSDQESFGRPITESYLCETPCLVTNVGGLSDQILDEETGYKIDPDEVQLGANKLVTLLQNEQLNHNFGVKGRKYVEQRFTLDSVSEEYQILINELLDLN